MSSQRTARTQSQRRNKEGKTDKEIETLPERDSEEIKGVSSSSKSRSNSCSRGERVRGGDEQDIDTTQSLDMSRHCTSVGKRKNGAAVSASAMQSGTGAGVRSKKYKGVAPGGVTGRRAGTGGGGSGSTGGGRRRKQHSRKSTVIAPVSDRSDSDDAAASDQDSDEEGAGENIRREVDIRARAFQLFDEGVDLLTQYYLSINSALVQY